MRGILKQAEQYALRLAAYFASDDDYHRHAQMVDETLERMHDEGHDSHSKHSILGQDGLRRWSPNRMRQQQQVLRYLHAKYANTPQEGKATILGGPPGAGKTRLTQQPGFNLDNHYHLDVDEMKNAMALHGMVPQVPELSPMESSALVHREAGDLVNQLAKMAYKGKHNVLWDHTMSNDEGLGRQINDLRGAGYNKVNGVFVHADPEVARGRTLDRHRGDEDLFRSGSGGPQDAGGRWVPSSVSRHNTSPVGQLSRGQQVFAKHQPSFDSTANIDTTSGTPTVTGTSGPEWQHLGGGQQNGNTTPTNGEV